jgi:hypothetical protein
MGKLLVIGGIGGVLGGFWGAAGAIFIAILLGVFDDTAPNTAQGPHHFSSSCQYVCSGIHY